MYRSHLILAWRNLLKHKAYALINLLGLTLGISCSLLVLLYIFDELSYDKHFPDADQIYRLNYQYKNEIYAITGFVNWWDADKDEQLLKVAAFKEIKGVESVAQFNATHGATMEKQPVYLNLQKSGSKEEKFTEKEVLLSNTGEDLYDIFQWEILYGSKENSFSKPYAAILSRATAERYFGENWNSKIRDQTLSWKEKDYPVTAVIENDDNNTHFSFDVILLTPEIPSWGAYVYFQLSPSASLHDVSIAVNEQLELVEPSIQDDPDEKGSYLQEVSDIHFSDNILFELSPSGDIQYVYIFGVIGLIILSITVTNYINLSVALYSRRKSEIGMRKVMGAARVSITWQFLSEAILLCAISLPLSLLLLELGIPYFNQIMDLELENQFVQSLSSFMLVLLFTIIVGLISGLYPALLLSGKNVLDLIRNQTGGIKERFALRRVMFVFQFTLLIALGSATILVNRQLNFINHKNLGFRKEGIVTFNPISSSNYQRIKNRLLRYPQFSQIGQGMVPGLEMSDNTSYKISGSETVHDNAGFWDMDWDAVKVLGIDISDISEETAPDEVIILNQASASNLQQQIGAEDKNELLGRSIMTHLEYQNEEGSYGKEYVVGGFVEELHLLSLKEKISPMLIKIDKTPDMVYWVILKVDAEQLSESLAILREVYADIVQDTPLEISFLENSLQHLYEQEQRVASLSFYLSIIAVVIATLGLMSMSAYLVSLRTREIGIRKVMGASVLELLMLLSKEFIFLVGVATVIATPFAYIFINRWLSDFAYRIDVNIWIFLFTGFICLIVAVAVVILQTIKTANKKPAITLKAD
ncbi:putative ABC transport system permease protein [Catalinimonas alkaloidigena]|uniref:ABC transporter permease n=1 Tax=Catalinimonas alkaloidigena TaxID=1075417 RepID=UPI002406EB39|nr:ABC transporter permease [Catalinimonas alkaloidigena]MDF9797465.1 putative ABC transport system permease protein [Catalinimonas alkaloidigena]